MNRKKISISLPENIVDQIDQLADERAINRTAYISMAVMEYIKADEMWKMLKEQKEKEGIK